MNIFDFVIHHASHALPILICGVFALAIVFERTRALYLKYPMRNMDGFFEELEKKVNTGSIQEAIRYCDPYSDKPAAKIVKTALFRAHLPETVIQDGLHIVMNDATQMIQKKTSFLATIANVATLLGLLGTIAGLIASFEAVGHADAQQKSALLSAGISTSMNATLLGLAISIPCMLAYSFLVNRSNQLVAELENVSIRTLDILKQRFYATEDFEEAAVAHGGGHGQGREKSRTAVPNGRSASFDKSGEKGGGAHAHRE